MEFAEVVRRRRMVRHFADEPVDRTVLERIALISQRAPSAGFSQGQRLLIVTDPALRRQIAAILGEEEGVEAGFDRWISECAAVFIPCVSEAVYHERYREADKVDDGGAEIDWPVPYWWMDIGCTVMLILLAAVDEGLAAGFAGAEAEGYVALRALLGIPDDFSPIGVIPVGRPLPDKRSPSLKRGWRPSEEFARWERW
ncbi:MAG TPA: nitroreductase family protein [Candidatus Limnocylindrales bacterium]